MHSYSTRNCALAAAKQQQLKNVSPEDMRPVRKAQLHTLDNLENIYITCSIVFDAFCDGYYYSFLYKKFKVN